MDNRCNIKSNKSYDSSKKSCSYEREKIKIVNKRKTRINKSDILSSKAAISLKAIISGAILGFVGGGARNTKNIVNNLRLSSAGNKAIKAITTASNKLISKEIIFKGFQGTLNLYAKTASLEI